MTVFCVRQFVVGFFCHNGFCQYKKLNVTNNIRLPAPYGIYILCGKSKYGSLFITATCNLHEHTM